MIIKLVFFQIHDILNVVTIDLNYLTRIFYLCYS